MSRAEAAHNCTRDATTPRSGVPPHATRAERHTQYLEDRGVGERQAAQAFWTAHKPSEIPEVFSKYQRRGAPALIAAFPSPDLETVGYQMHSDYPYNNRDGKKLKWVSPPGDNARMVLGVLPEMIDSVRTGSGPLWSVEGITRAAALASFDIPAVAFAGCYGWQKDGEPLECWRHVNLKSRLVLVAFDADYRTNPDVHEALRRHVAFLEGEGARVVVVDVPKIDGEPNTGLDDWIAVNGHPAALERNAQPFAPVDIVRERLSKDEKLAAMVADLWRAWRIMPTVKRGECTDRSTVRELIREAERRGKPVADGIKVSPALRTLAPAVKVSIQGQANSLKRLETAGFLRTTEEPRKRGEPRAYILLSNALKGRALGRHNEEKERLKRREGKEQEGVSSLSQAESFLRVNLTRGSDEIPELRWPTILRRQERNERGQLVEVYEYLARLGKKRGEMVRFLLESGGVSNVPELMERFASPRARPRDFRRRNLDMLAERPAILLIEGDVVSLAPKWREALEHAREVAGEQEANRLQVEKIARQREAFRRRDEHQPEPEPEMPQVDDMRDHWSVHPDGCACRACEERFGRVIGEHPEGCRCARCYSKLKEDATRKNPNRRVVPLQPRKRSERNMPDRVTPATVTEIPNREEPAEVDTAEPLPGPPPVNDSQIWECSTSPPKRPPKVDGVFVHGPLCDCFLCEDDAEPSYTHPVEVTA